MAILEENHGRSFTVPDGDSEAWGVGCRRKTPGCSGDKWLTSHIALGPAPNARIHLEKKCYFINLGLILIFWKLKENRVP